MPSLSALPSLNAGLNAASAALLTAGWLFIRRRRIGPHRLCMVAAFLCSAVFLASYLCYHARAGVVHYRGGGVGRVLYLALLASHTVLAAAIVPLVLTTLTLAARGRIDRHRAWARWTLPLWLYVSVTGVAVYEILYRLQ